MRRGDEHNRTDRDRRNPLRDAALFLFCLALTGCAHPHFDGTLLTKREASYRVGALPEAWHRVSVEDADLAFHSAGQGTISVNATCSDYDDVPAIALVNHLFFGTTKRHYLVDEDVTIDGRGARHVIVDCELDGVPFRAEVYLMSRNGCVFDLDYVSDRNAQGHRAFADFVTGFSIERAGHD